MKHKIIAFSGLDGTGKSTQIDLLKKKLLQNGNRTKTIWSRGGYTPGFNLLKKVLRKIFNKKLPEAGRSSERTQVIKKLIIAKLWLHIAIFDLILLYAIYFRILVILNYYLIADRYIIDTQIDFILNFPSIRFEKWLIWKIFTWISPHPQIIYLDIPLEISLDRLAAKEEPFPDSKDVLEKRLSKYKELYNSRNACIIEADEPVNIVHTNILNALNEN